MRNRRPIGLKRGPAGRGPASVGGKALGGHDILTLTESVATNVLVTTAAPHGLVGSESIVISGTANGTYDGTKEVAGDPVPTATTFAITDPYSADDSGGRWDLA
jgi:hypothetical protein